MRLTLYYTTTVYNIGYTSHVLPYTVINKTFSMFCCYCCVPIAHFPVVDIVFAYRSSTHYTDVNEFGQSIYRLKAQNMPHFIVL